MAATSTTPATKTNAENFPEVKRLLDLGLHSKQHTFDLAGQSEAGKIYREMSPSHDGTKLDATADLELADADAMFGPVNDTANTKHRRDAHLSVRSPTATVPWHRTSRHPWSNGQ